MNAGLKQKQTKLH